ncbi:Flp pilus assembly complex ATPase component TadA [Campylobacter sp. faydin G-140]|uniref:ATPase, T2SS/T4P/T4SS family n=1 Tax=Campylobacter anatolicus TaxID=2829105 RepID=UPI001B9E9D2C|nr:ATPase, T2SS/T4P/T4SS family [Campylobacter anatolicus]MBR8466526.1 Flp pilus assembly complex ATPase component TadA [Campylobacter anatolicus]
MSVSTYLKNILAHLKPYLELKANELCFNEPKKICVDYGNHWEYIDDESLDLRLLNDFLVELATSRHQQFDEKHCHLSCELPAPFLRYRVQAQHSSSLFNSQISICIRIPSKERYPLENFVLSEKVINDGWTYDKIKSLIHDRKNVLLSGGTGSGKTSFLNSLMGEIDANERIVTIEDSQELQVDNKNKTQLAVPKIATEIYSYQVAIDNAMRLRPDRLFLGEIDIRNTFSFLRVNNTGHAGNLSTLHANNPKDAIKAIKTNVILGGGLSNADDTMLESLIVTAIDYIIQIQRDYHTNQRVITDILNVKEQDLQRLAI